MGKRTKAFLKALLACILALNMFACPMTALASVQDDVETSAKTVSSASKETSPSSSSTSSSDKTSPTDTKATSDSGDSADTGPDSSKDSADSTSDSDKTSSSQNDDGSSTGSSSSSAEADDKSEARDEEDGKTSSSSSATSADKTQSAPEKGSQSASSADADSGTDSVEADVRESDDKARGVDLDLKNVIDKIVISYISEEDYKNGKKAKEYDPDDPNEKVGIDRREGRLRLTAIIHYKDGSTESSSESDTSIKWQIVSTRPSDGSSALPILAKLQSSGSIGSNKWLAATAQGNGEVTILCSSRVHPDFKGQRMKVSITNNQFQSQASDGDRQENPLTVDTATAYVVSDQNSSTLSTTGKISSRLGSCQIDFKLALSDGTNAMASDLGLNGSYGISKTYGPTGATVNSAIAKVAPGGCVWALGEGDGSVDVSCSFNEKDAGTIKVKITGNAIPGTAQVTPVSMTFTFTDANHKTPITYSSKNENDDTKVPLIADERGHVTFNAKLNMSNGTVTDAADSIYDVQWKLIKMEDEQGNLTNSQLGFLSPTGTFTALNQGNGVAYVSATLVGANVPSTPTSMRIKILNNDNKPYVTGISILGTSGQDLGDGGIDISKAGAAHTFHALVRYNDGSEKNTFLGQKVEGLEWKTVRPVSNADELYSHIDENGNFYTDPGFLECKLMATVKEADKYGRDISKDLRIFDGQETERVGYTSKLTFHIVYESEYRKFGSSAQVAKEIEVTYDDLMTKAQPYTDWFTFRRNGGSWGTIYANGISIPKLLTAIGIDVNDMRFMQFSDKVGYTGDSGFYSDSIILGSRYRYSNYYMHAVSLNPGYLGQSSVVPMLATSIRFDYGNDYNGSFSGMERDSTFRLLMGMAGVEDGNARRMVRCVSDINVIVTDPATEKPAPGNQGGSGNQNGSGGSSNTGGSGNGIGSGTGDGSGSDTGGGGGSGNADGQAQDGSGGQNNNLDAENSTGGGQSQAMADSDADSLSKLSEDGRSMATESGTLLLRELTPQEIEELEDLMPIPWMDRYNPFRIPAVVLAIISLASAAVFYELRFRRNNNPIYKKVAAS